MSPVTPRRRLSAVVITAILVAIPTTAPADVVYMKDGFVLHGKVRREADLIVDTATGAMIPITNVALGTLAPDRLKNASGLFNLSRNLGGAVGLAALNTVLDHRIDLHLARLHEAVNWSRQPAQEMLTNLTARFHDFGGDAQAMAMKQLMALTRQQGIVMAFADVFLVLAVVFVAFGALAFVMRRPAPAAAAAGH